MTLRRAYLAMSLDGLIAGEGGDLGWLEESAEDQFAVRDWAQTPSDALGFEEFFADVGCLLMGRTTYDTVRGFAGPWPYGDTPVCVATSRPLDASPPPTVSAVSGTVSDMVARAAEAAGDGDVYVDGGALVRSVIDVGLLDELTLTMVPVVLGAGTRLFDRMPIQAFDVSDVRRYAGGMVQLTLVPRASGT